MGLPKFPESENILSREEAINAILTSIAMEETALSHIITAESEKIQFVINEARSNPGCSTCNVLKANKSAADMLDKVNDMQILLKSKLRIAASFVPDITPPCPPDPPVPPPKPCTSVFIVKDEYDWSKGFTLDLEMHKSCNNGVKLGTINDDNVILLPPGKAFEISLELNMENTEGCPAFVEIVLGHSQGFVHAQKYCHNGKTPFFDLTDTLTWRTSGPWKERFIAVRLTMPEKIKVLSGKVLITEQIC